MSWNTFGRVLRFTTWGESHGPALGAVVEAMMALVLADHKLLHRAQCG